MAIVQKQQAPQLGPTVISRALQDLRAPINAEFALGGAQLKISQPLPVYRLGLEHVLRPDLLKRAVHTGWRYLLEGTAGGSVGYADVKEPKGGVAKFSSLSHNKNANRLMEAAHLAQKIAAGLSDDYEARVLDISALYTSAIWLDGRSPIFIPYISPEIARGERGVQVDPAFLDEVAKKANRALRHLPVPDRA